MQKERNENNKLPKIYMVLKIIGFSLLILGIILLILSFVLFKEQTFDSNVSKMGLRFGGACSIIFSFVFNFIGFSPNIAKLQVKTKKYLINENKEDLTDISSVSGDIAEPHVKKITKAVKEQLTDESGENKKYCKYCGKPIDSDAIFCDKCGKKQD